MKLKQTLNIERPTSNIERQSLRACCGSMFDVGRSMLDVRLNSPRLTRRAFSFAEVMFAVVILGIGFIMVAAVFPVAIRQTQTTGEENTAASAARTAASVMTSLPATIPNPYNLQWYSAGNTAAPAAGTPASVVTLSLFPPTVKNYVIGSNVGSVAPPSIVVPFVGPRWDLVKANIISNTDPRFSYVPFYRRDNNSSFAELIVVAVANRNRANYDSTDTQTSTAAKTQFANQSTVTITSAMSVAHAPTSTTIYPDTLTLMANPTSPLASLDGATVTVAVTAAPIAYRTFTLGQSLNPTTYTQYELNTPDNLILSPGSGLWGTAGTGWISDSVSTIVSAPTTINLPTTLQPTVAYATLVATPTNPTGEILLSTTPDGSALPPAAVQGAFVIVADDFPFDAVAAYNATYSLHPNSAVAPVYQVGALNGRIFRLGPAVTPNVDQGNEGGTFLLDPAYAMRPGVNGSLSPDEFYVSATAAVSYPPGLSANSRLKVYIIGAGTINGSVSGAAQDTGVFATYFQVQ